VSGTVLSSNQILSYLILVTALLDRPTLPLPLFTNVSQTNSIWNWAVQLPSLWTWSLFYTAEDILLFDLETWFQKWKRLVNSLSHMTKAVICWTPHLCWVCAKALTDIISFPSHNSLKNYCYWPFIQMGRLRLGQGQKLTQTYTASKWQKWALDQATWLQNLLLAGLQAYERHTWGQTCLGPLQYDCMGKGGSLCSWWHSTLKL
jgi:hypothetical protein